MMSARIYGGIAGRCDMKKQVVKGACNDAGFTSIELLVVISILANLAAVAIPTFLG